MNPAARVAAYDSRSQEYERAFQVFLQNTDQKTKARAWLDRLVQRLPQRRVFIDAGAGNGKVTTWYLPSFQHTLAIEPNPHLRDELKQTCQSAEVLPDTILAAKPAAAGDLVLCMHVFYYIDGNDWLANLDRLTSWVSPQGVLVLVLQNHETDCMRMLEKFHGRRFELAALARTFSQKNGNRYDVKIDTVPATVATADFDSAYIIAEFMLNLLPMPKPPPRADLEAYVRKNLADQSGGFRFSCDQDFLQIRPKK